MIYLIWFLAAALAFAILLAAQMRLLLSSVLRRALADKFGGGHQDARYRTAIFEIGRGPPTSEDTLYLTSEYPRPLAHLTLARRVSLFAPGLLLIVILAGRFAFGAF